MKQDLFTWHLFWAPTGQKIGTVKSADERSAIRKAPQPYRKFLGEIYAVRVSTLQEIFERTSTLNDHSLD